MLKCGITGHSGTLGSQLIKKKFNFKFIIFKDDICRKKKIYQWIKKNKPDLILHIAAIVPTRVVENNFSYANSVNYMGTKNLVDAIVENNLNLKWMVNYQNGELEDVNHPNWMDNQIKQGLVPGTLVKQHKKEKN